MFRSFNKAQDEAVAKAAAFFTRLSGQNGISGIHDEPGLDYVLGLLQSTGVCTGREDTRIQPSDTTAAVWTREFIKRSTVRVDEARDALSVVSWLTDFIKRIDFRPNDDKPMNFDYRGTPEPTSTNTGPVCFTAPAPEVEPAESPPSASRR